MKTRITLFFLFTLIFSGIRSQNIPNAGFDSIYLGGIDRVYEWVTGDGFKFNSGTSNDTVNSLLPDTYYSGGHEIYENIGIEYVATLEGYALIMRNTPHHLKNNGDPYVNFIVNGSGFYTGSDGYIDFSKGGSPFTFRPSALTVNYWRDTLDIADVDYCATASVLLKKYNAALNKIDTVAHGSSELPCDIGKPMPWRHVDVPIQYMTPEIPDSIVVIITINRNDPSMGEINLTFDELSFLYGPIGIYPTEDKSEISLFPNPNAGTLHIVSDNIERYKKYRLIDMNGKLLREGMPTETIDISEFAKGKLFLQLINADGKTETLRVIKQ